jgi:transcriptional regulator with XRE-family HTH domain
MSLKEKIQEILQDKGLTPSELADSIGIGENSVCKIMRGDTVKLQMKSAKKINLIYP